VRAEAAPSLRWERRNAFMNRGNGCGERIYPSRRLGGGERVVSVSRVLRFTSGGRMVIRVRSSD
jgi:hypothetical protein